MKDLVRFIASLSLAFLIVFCTKETGNKKPVSSLLTGADLLISQNINLLTGKNIGVVANHTSLLKNGVHIVDTLNSLSEIVNLVKVFSPEHGYKGKASAGELLGDSVSSDNFKIVSLYGKKKKPSPSDLKDVDLLIFDIQDIGVRFYTYISTLYYVIEACAENNKKLIVLDRPNPISNLGFSGNLTEKKFESFISIAPIPTIHAMTVGELAQLFNNEFINSANKADLEIIKLQNWQRNLPWQNYNLPWIKPSPNIPDYQTALLYPLLCFIEGLNISEGRGTFKPFKVIGAPFIDSDDLFNKLEAAGLAGVKIKKTMFTPEQIPEMSKYPKYENKLCYGIEFEVSDINKYNPLINAIKILKSIVHSYPKKIKFRDRHFDLLWGNDKLRNLLSTGQISKENLNNLVKTDQEFVDLRAKYLLY